MRCRAANNDTLTQFEASELIVEFGVDQPSVGNVLSYVLFAYQNSAFF
jgi:hypothetical protein